MKNYTVDYVKKIWVEVNVKAETEIQAKEKAKELIRNASLKGSRSINVLDETDEYSGVRDIDVLDIYPQPK